MHVYISRYISNYNTLMANKTTWRPKRGYYITLISKLVKGDNYVMFLSLKKIAVYDRLSNRMKWNEMRQDVIIHTDTLI